MPDLEPRGINPNDFVGKVFSGDKYDPLGSLILTQAYRALATHNRERYETPDDDPALKLSLSESIRRVSLATQDPIFQERIRPLEQAVKSGLILSEEGVREISIEAWDRVHDYMAAENPNALLAQTRRQRRNSRGSVVVTYLKKLFNRRGQGCSN